MLKVISIIFFFLSCYNNLYSQMNQIFVQNRCLFTIHENKVFTGNSTSFDKLTFTIINSGNKQYICNCSSSDISNALYTFFNQSVYNGSSTSSSYLAYTIHGNNVYIGVPGDFNEVLYRIFDNTIYNGNTSSVVATYKGEIRKELLTVLLR